jgi:hypothetical protein
MMQSFKQQLKICINFNAGNFEQGFYSFRLIFQRLDFRCMPLPSMIITTALRIVLEPVK